MTETGIIYRWTNVLTGKHYIGQTINPEQRKRNHIHEAMVAGSDYYFHRSLRKNGTEAFAYEVLEENVPRDQLNNRENFYIDKFNAIWPNGYNQQYANSLSVEAIDKMSQTKKRQWADMTPEKRLERVAHLTKIATGRPQTDRQKKRATEANQKQWEITDPNNVTFEITNLSKFCKENNLDQGNMVAVSKGRLKQHKGYRCVLVS